MSSSSFAIVDLRDGVRRDVQSFLVNNDSFPTLENAYLFRGRIQKRSCFTIVGGTDGRLKGTFSGNANGAGHFIITLLDGTVSGGIPNAVASFNVSGTVAGLPASSILTDPTGGSPVILLTTNPAITGTLDTATGILDIAGLDAGTAVVLTYIPGIPVMGLKVREQAAINDELLIAFDTRYTYLFDVGTNDFIFQNTFARTLNTFVWTGTDRDFFWSCNYFKAFWSTNNIAGLHAAQNASVIADGDGIRWYGTLSGGAPPPGTSNLGWRNFNPRLDSLSTSFLLGGLIILPYKNRLVVLNTLEGLNLGASTRFSQRARWCQNGTPFYGDFPEGASAQATAWDAGANDIGKGGFIDAPTSEVIISAEFLKDTLIVYFERSTWQLVYTNNETLPFVWQKINTELGCESTFSTVPFDRGVFAVGNYGIITTDSVNVVRIDEKIPDEVFQIQNKNQGTQRVHGIRDYNAQLVYWTFPILVDEDNDSPTYELTYPNQVLVYNYLDGSWAEFDDCFTCFGYWQRFSDVTWEQLNRAWQSETASWNSSVFQARYPDVIAGNQRGFVMVVSQLQQLGQNTPSLPIANIAPGGTLATITATNHNLTNNQYVLITGVQGTTGINNFIYKVVQATVNTFVINQTQPPPPLPPLPLIAGTYTGGGVLTHIPNIKIQTKEFNPFYENGDSLRLNYIDLYLDRTDDGEFTAQFFTSDNTSSPIESAIVTTAPEPQPTYSTPSPTTNYQLTQSKIWHRVYTNSFGSFVQNIFIFSDAQMKDLDIATSDVTIHGLIYYVAPSGRVSYDI